MRVEPRRPLNEALFLSRIATIEEYRKITNQQENILDLLAMPDAAEVEFEPPRLSGNLHRPADLG
jgi:hypothetical protein